MQSDFLDTISRDAGSGSRSYEEDWLDANSTSAEQTWSSAQTFFYPDDAPAELKEKYKRLKDWNDNKWSSERKAELNQKNMQADLETFCNILGLTQNQEDRVKYLFEDLDLSKELGGRSYEKIILSLCTLVTDSDIPNNLENIEQKFNQRLVFSEEFEELRQVVDMSRGEHKKIRQRIRESSKEWESVK